MGLLFFAPLFDPESRVTVWGPPHPTAGIRRRLARYLSAPLCPIEIRDLPARMRFRTVPSGSFRLGSAEIEAALVNHRGPTLGYRVTDGDAVLAYIPDHEPALGQDLERDPCESISGLALARDASLLIHDAQYTAEEYVGTRGWGHSTLHDALAFARRAEAEHVALFHHDPAHNDAHLDAIAAEAAGRLVGARRRSGRGLRRSRARCYSSSQRPDERRGARGVNAGRVSSSGSSKLRRPPRGSAQPVDPGARRGRLTPGLAEARPARRRARPRPGWSRRARRRR